MLVSRKDRNVSDLNRQDEFMTLVADCQPQMMACICALIHNMVEVEELYQQACLVMWRKFDTYRPGTHFDKWACSIAYLEVEVYLRRQRTRKCFGGELVDRLAPRENGAPTGEGNRRIQALRACLNRLAADDRRLINLRYWERKMVLEIAADLGRMPQSICNSLRRIRSQLMGGVERTLLAEDRT